MVTLIRIGREAADVVERDYGYLVRLFPRGRSLKNLQLLRMVMRPHTRSRLHQHPSEEIFHVLSGAVVVRGADDDVVALEEGDTVAVPANAPHALENRTDEMATLVLALSPPRDRASVVYLEEGDQRAGEGDESAEPEATATENTGEALLLWFT